MGAVIEADKTFYTYATIGSTVKSDDLTIFGVIQPDAEWHWDWGAGQFDAGG